MTFINLSLNINKKKLNAWKSHIEACSNLEKDTSILWLVLLYFSVCRIISMSVFVFKPFQQCWCCFAKYQNGYDWATDNHKHSDMQFYSITVRLTEHKMAKINFLLTVSTYSMNG